jgi:hypothetical protein
MSRRSAAEKATAETPACEVDVLDDADVARRVAAGELVSSRSLGAPPLNEFRMKQLRELAARRIPPRGSQ